MYLQNIMTDISVWNKVVDQQDIAVPSKHGLKWKCWLHSGALENTWSSVQNVVNFAFSYGDILV